MTDRITIDHIELAKSFDHATVMLSTGDTISFDRGPNGWAAYGVTAGGLGWEGDDHETLRGAVENAIDTINERASASM